MKYLKSFEKYKGEYWLVDTKYLEIAVNKLNLSEEQKKYLLNNTYINGKEKYYNNSGVEYYIDSIYIPVGDVMNWIPANDPDDKNNIDKYFYKNLNKKYMGKLKITPEDIIEYEMKKKC
jgi:hypothetical protein